MEIWQRRIPLIKDRYINRMYSRYGNTNLKSKRELILVLKHLKAFINENVRREKKLLLYKIIII